jgi:phosphodiesterase/alkaline phosphatase D-like protein
MPRVWAGAVSERGARVRIDDWGGVVPDLELVPLLGGERLAPPEPVVPGNPSSPLMVDVTGLHADTVYELRLGAPASAPAIIRTPPKSLAPDRGLSLALLSCYFPSDLYVGRAGRVAECLYLMEAGGRPPPHLKIFCGDQIYGDVPPTTSGDAAKLCDTRYRDAWMDSRFGRVLARGANIFAADDHEYWNGFPDSQFQLQRSRDLNWAAWGQRCREALWREQLVWNFAPGITGGNALREGWCAWSMAGVDFFIADTRSDRTSVDGTRRPNATSVPGASFLAPAQRGALDAWIGSVDRLGVLTLGQPLFANTAGSIDNTLPDYPEDYGHLVKALTDAVAERGISIIVLTGDIHWGRVVYWEPQGGRRAGAKLVEVVASPVARVNIGSFLGRWWPTVFERSSMKLDVDEFQKVAPGRVTALCATNENNFAALDITGGGILRLRCDLWSLDQKARAANRWGSGSCEVQCDL